MSSFFFFVVGIYLLLFPSLVSFAYCLFLFLVLKSFESSLVIKSTPISIILEN